MPRLVKTARLLAGRAGFDSLDRANARERDVAKRNHACTSKKAWIDRANAREFERSALEHGTSHVWALTVLLGRLHIVIGEKERIRKNEDHQEKR